MMSMFELEALAAHRQRQLAEELDRAYVDGPLPGASLRERLAGALIAVAVWLAPSARAAVAGSVSQAGRAAHTARA